MLRGLEAVPFPMNQPYAWGDRVVMESRVLLQVVPEFAHELLAESSRAYPPYTYIAAPVETTLYADR